MVKVIASDGKTGDTRDISYTNCKIIGNGSFGIVFQAKLVSEHDAGDDIAIKKVLQDKRFKVSGDWIQCRVAFKRSYTDQDTTSVVQNRELQIMRLVSHPNVVDLKAFFYSNGDKVCVVTPSRCHALRKRLLRL